MLSWTLLFLALTADQWTQFRGPNGSGVDSSAGYPSEFAPTKNVAWKAAIPYGQSSPVLAGGHVYLTASEPDKLLTICLDAKTGKELWRRALPRKKPQTIFRANDPASPTPVADDNGVVAFFAEFGLVVVFSSEANLIKFDLVERWKLRNDLGDPGIRWGLFNGLDDFKDLVSFDDQKAESALLQFTIQNGCVPTVDASMIGIALQIIGGERGCAGKINRVRILGK